MIKISTLGNKILTVCHENESHLLAEMVFQIYCIRLFPLSNLIAIMKVD